MYMGEMWNGRQGRNGGGKGRESGIHPTRSPLWSVVEKTKVKSICVSETCVFAAFDTVDSMQRNRDTKRALPRCEQKTSDDFIMLIKRITFCDRCRPIVHA